MRKRMLILFMVIGCMIFMSCGSRRNDTSSNRSSEDAVSKITTESTASKTAVKEIEILGDIMTVPQSAFIIGPDHDEYPLSSEDENIVYLVFEDDETDKQEKWRNQLNIIRTEGVNTTEPITWDQAKTIIEYHADMFIGVNSAFQDIKKEIVELDQTPAIHYTAENQDYNSTYDLWFLMNNYRDVVTFFFIHSNEANTDYTEKVDKAVLSIHISGLDGDNALKKESAQDTEGKDGQKQTNFTNKYGTPTTKCAHSGCSNYIATSGDTNCCTTHSNKCLECGKYIDEDATYCMDCLTKALSN